MHHFSAKLGRYVDGHAPTLGNVVPPVKAARKVAARKRAPRKKVQKQLPAPAVETKGDED